MTEREAIVRALVQLGKTDPTSFYRAWAGELALTVRLEPAKRTPERGRQ